MQDNIVDGSVIDGISIQIGEDRHTVIDGNTVTNSGRVTGDEVVQLYVRDVLASVARPVMELKGFQRIRLEPGQSRDVSFTLDQVQLRMLDRNMTWVVEPGVFRVMIGASSKDIRLRGELIVK